MKRLMLTVSSACGGGLEGDWGLGMDQSYCAREPARCCIGHLLRGAWVPCLMWKLQEPKTFMWLCLQCLPRDSSATRIYSLSNALWEEAALQFLAQQKQNQSQNQVLFPRAACCNPSWLPALGTDTGCLSPPPSASSLSAQALSSKSSSQMQRKKRPASSPVLVPPQLAESLKLICQQICLWMEIRTQKINNASSLPAWRECWTCCCWKPTKPVCQQHSAKAWSPRPPDNL